MLIEPAHKTFPLTSTALSRLSLTPEFEYPDPYNARLVSARLLPPMPAFTPAEISAVGLMGKIFLYLIRRHIHESCPSAFEDLDGLFSRDKGAAGVDKLLHRILDDFPTSPSYYLPEKRDDYGLANQDPTHRYGLYQSIFLLILSDRNPALTSRDRIFTSPDLRLSSVAELYQLIQNYFSNQPGVSRTGKDILSFLGEPANQHPDSIADQLAFIRENWSSFLTEDLMLALLTSLDRIKEETISRFVGRPDPENPLLYAKASYLDDTEMIRFSDDLDWMPRLILLAKNIYVWLDQLSKRYQRPIHRLDHIPDQELSTLQAWGINGLWMIGLWERSPASQRIKQICGNLDAVPSAYSVYDYQIASALGGEEAYQNLSDRAASFNIRLAADMVPNHMGVYSKWIVEHPDWFLSLDQPPYPGYSFRGEDLSLDRRSSIFIEDHYYDQTDAAVTFKHVDNQTGIERHIYHGNDGTAMPWNDTAQIDFLNPSAREAVIQTILLVAKKFPIIRFDAAMTLAKKHIQRLWFPEPGSGGAIPTRADHGMTKKEFDKLMPEEFWREVVDRVAAEAPDTLLLAEAFWMMEGYFVRSLGMHRVYNSAFMHMLRDEKNQEYRNLIIETLEYDPQILKRYVNFMNNPDEETAIQQFGSDGKYFGACVLMATLPGLPMIGHGQIEGLHEKYGMEYRRAYYDEQPNQGLIERHQREIFPLFHKRYLFSDVKYFHFYDFIADSGSLIPDVFAYSNRSGNERGLVIYHNKWGDAIGRVRFTTPVQGSSISLLTALDFSSAEDTFILYKDLISGLEYLVSTQSLLSEGLHFELGSYHYQVFVDFHLVSDPDGRFAHLADKLHGRGVPSIQEALDELEFGQLASWIAHLTESMLQLSPSELKPGEKLSAYLSNLAPNAQPVLAADQSQFSFHFDFRMIDVPALHNLLLLYPPETATMPSYLPFLLAWFVIQSLPDFQDSLIPLSRLISPRIDLPDVPHSYPRLMDCFSIAPLLTKSLVAARNLINLPRVWFNEPAIQEFLRVNEHNGISWFNQESFQSLLSLTAGLLLLLPDLYPIDKPPGFSEYNNMIEALNDLASDSSYQVDLFLEKLDLIHSNGTDKRSKPNR